MRAADRPLSIVRQSRCPNGAGGELFRRRYAVTNRGTTQSISPPVYSNAVAGGNHEEKDRGTYGPRRGGGYRGVRNKHAIVTVGRAIEYSG